MATKTTYEIGLFKSILKFTHYKNWGSQSIWLLEPIFSEHQAHYFSTFWTTMRNQFLPSSCSDCLNMMTVPCPPQELWLQGRGTQYPIPRNDNFTSLGLFYSLSAWFRLYKGSLLETFWIIRLSLSNTHPRDQIRGTCVRMREGDGLQNFMSKQGLRGPQRVQQLSVKLRAMCWRPG